MKVLNNCNRSKVSQVIQQFCTKGKDARASKQELPEQASKQTKHQCRPFIGRRLRKIKIFSTIEWGESGQFSKVKLFHFISRPGVQIF